MNDLVKTLTIKLILLLLVGIIGMLAANKIIFMHSHQLSDGSIVTHAHPFNKSKDTAPFKHHQHSDTDYFLLQSLEWLFPLLLLFFTGINLIGKPALNLYRDSIIATFFNGKKAGRAPPLT